MGFVQLVSFPREVGTFEKKNMLEEEEEKEEQGRKEKMKEMGLKQRTGE